MNRAAAIVVRSAFFNVTARHLVYLFRWKKGWRGISKWREGIGEFVTNGSVVK